MIKAKKSLGQHFLKSERALSVIVETGKVGIKDTVLEIGPGTGTLTEKLLETGAKVIAIEKDDGLYKFLQEKFKNEIGSGQLNLVHSDILKFNFKSYKLETGNYKLIANIPYNITGAILKKFLQTDNQPKRMVLLVQKEVAERIVGNRGRQASTVKESVLSISIKAYGTPSYIETVRAGSFVPMPKVDSAIIAIEDISKDFFNCGRQASTEEGVGFSEKKFFEMVRVGFKSKRKKLSSNLSSILPKERVVDAFRELDLDENVRAENLDTEVWRKLAQILL